MLQNRLQPVLDPNRLAREMSGKMLIDGGMVPSVTGRTFAIVNPATQEKIGDAADGNAADVDAAVKAAAKAQKGWAKLVARERGRMIAECGRILSDHVEELANRHGGRAFEVRALVSTRVRDHQVIGCGEEGVEEELPVLGAGVSVADMGIGEDQVIAPSFTHPGERPVVETKQAHYAVRNRPHGDERADGQVPGPEVGSSRTSLEAVGKERANIAGVEHDRGDGVIHGGLVRQVVEQSLKLRPLPGILLRRCG